MPGRLCFAGAVVTPAEFQLALEARREAKPKAAQRPLTDDEVSARIALLRRENALLRERAKQLQNKEAERMALEIIKGRQRPASARYGSY